MSQEKDALAAGEEMEIEEEKSEVKEVRNIFFSPHIIKIHIKRFDSSVSLSKVLLGQYLNLNLIPCF